MNTIRELIILELIARAAVIRTAGSPQVYATDIGETILRARKLNDAEECPCCVIWPQAETAENIYGKSKHIMSVQIEGLVAFGNNDPRVTGDQIFGDLIKCFASPAWDRRRIAASPVSPITYLEPYADSIWHAGGEPMTPEDGSKTVGAQALFSVIYTTAIGDPYTQ